MYDEEIAEVKKSIHDLKVSIRMSEDGPGGPFAPASDYELLNELRGKLSSLLALRNISTEVEVVDSAPSFGEEELEALGLEGFSVSGKAERIVEIEAVPTVAELKPREGVSVQLFGKTIPGLILHDGDHVELKVRGGVVYVEPHENGLDQ